jgi:hypothetical protein
MHRFRCSAAITFTLLFASRDLSGNDGNTACGGRHKEGDTIVCYVAFRTDPTLDNLELGFLGPSDGNGDASNNIILRESHKVCPGVFAVSGRVESVVPGNFVPVSILAAVRPNAWRNYGNVYGFKSDAVLTIEKAVGPNSKTSVPGTGNPSTESQSLSAYSRPPPDPHIFPSLESIHGKKPTTPCEGGHKPGSKISCYVTFAGASSFTMLTSAFYSRVVPEDEAGLCSSVVFRESRKISKHTYKITGMLPACASGKYVLSSLVAHTATDMRVYNNGSDYKDDVPVIRLDNPHQTLFSEIIYVGAASPCD